MIRFAVIGTNWITRQFVDAAHETGKYKLTAVYSRSLEQAQTFANDYPVEHLFTSLEAMAQSEAIDAVYIASPNSLHFPQTELFLRHKKHVICEKPLASNLAQAEAAIACARENQVVLFEAFKTASLPNFLLLQQSLPKVGRIRKAFINYCQYSSRYDKFRQGIVLNAFNPELSNGAMMDIGVYTVYPMVALFGRPLEVEAQGIVLSSGADGQGVVNFRYEGMNATVLYSKIANSSLPTEIQGEEGNLLLDAIHTIRDVAYLPRPAAASGRGDAPVRHSVGLPLEKDTYYYEVAEFIDLIEQGRIESTVNSHENSLVTMEIIDQVRRQLGVSYPADRLP